MVKLWLCGCAENCGDCCLWNQGKRSTGGATGRGSWRYAGVGYDHINSMSYLRLEVNLIVFLTRSKGYPYLRKLISHSPTFSEE